MYCNPHDFCVGSIPGLSSFPLLYPHVIAQPAPACQNVLRVHSFLIPCLGTVLYTKFCVILVMSYGDEMKLVAFIF